MSDDFDIVAVYVDLDSLFDTRLATLMQMVGPEGVDRVIRGGYFDRRCDEFDGVDTAAFKAAYAKRDVNTLKEAMATPVVPLVKLFAQQTLVAVVASPFRKQPKVTVNTFPYQLLPAEEVIIIEGLREATQGLMDIELIHLNPTELTPEKVKEQFIQIIMYDYVEWFEAQTVNGGFSRTQCPLVQMRAPGLIQSLDAVKKLEGVDYINAIEVHAQMFITLELLAARIFSVDMNRLSKQNAAGATT